jgi:23S rRNA pseudouridine1911/1915/1917 synthase
VRIEVGVELVGERLDVIVARATGLGRGATRRLFAAGKVHLSKGTRTSPAKKGQLAERGTALEIDVDEQQLRGATPNPDLPLDVVYESASHVVVAKPAPMPSAPLRPGETASLANALLARYPEMATIGYAAREPGLCHRLDTGTSGLVMAARTREAFVELTTAIRAGAIDKRYLLLCTPPPPERAGSIEQALRTEGRRVRVDAAGRPARTTYRILEDASGIALVEATASPATRHQIRVHMAFVGSPLLGDVQYGGPKIELPHRHALHASRLAYGGGPHVAPFEIDAPLPAELRALLDAQPA